MVFISKIDVLSIIIDQKYKDYFQGLTLKCTLFAYKIQSTFFNTKKSSVFSMIKQCSISFKANDTQHLQQDSEADFSKVVNWKGIPRLEYSSSF